MKRIGITGGIGSGKSFVCNLFEQFGYKVYAADARARHLMTSDAELIAGVKELFGAEAYLDDGSLNRGLIGGIVFQNERMLAKLNALVHPATGRDFERWCKEISDTGYQKPFVLKEAAILFESGSHKSADGVIAVYAPKSLRLQRAMQRDGAKAEAIQHRMAKQWPESQKLGRADFILINDGVHHLLPQIRAAMQFFG